MFHYSRKYNLYYRTREFVNSLGKWVPWEQQRNEQTISCRALPNAVRINDSWLGWQIGRCQPPFANVTFHLIINDMFLFCCCFLSLPSSICLWILPSVAMSLERPVYLSSCHMPSFRHEMFNEKRIYRFLLFICWFRRFFFYTSFYRDEYRRRDRYLLLGRRSHVFPLLIYAYVHESVCCMAILSF